MQFGSEHTIRISKFRSNKPSEVLNWRLAAGVRRIEARESSQESSDDSNNLSTIWHMSSSFLQNKECSLGIDAT
jgi:hypothetical protein